MKSRLVVHVQEQVMDLIQEKGAVRRFAISTSRHGLGSEPGSYKTPLGKHRIARKVGDGLPKGAVLKSREWTGSLWMAEDPWQFDVDLVLSRALWLEGCEDANATSFDRFIYIHGTNQEHLIGQPMSQGCIRMRNEDVLELFDLVEEGAEVEIVA